jgi:hypothetical protein
LYTDELFGIRGAPNRLKLSFHTISGGAAGCTGLSGDAGPSPRLTELSLRAPGAYESICRPDWALMFDTLSRAILGSSASFFFDDLPVVGSINVTVDGVRIPPFNAAGDINWIYGPTENAIYFNPFATPHPDAEVIVSYQSRC